MAEAGQIPYGERLLLSIIEERARNGHARPYASIPVSENIQDGYRDISYGIFSNAINRCAQWIVDNVGRSTSGEVLAYIGPSDVRYAIVSMAANKCGFAVFFLSPRNSMEAFENLFEQSATTKLLVASKVPPVVGEMCKRLAMESLTIPELSDLLDESPVSFPPFSKTFSELRTKTWILLHTSGSTGMPKVIPLRHGYYSPMDAFNLFGSELATRSGNKRVFSPFPAFHMAGIIWQLPVVIIVDSTLVFPPEAPLTAAVATSVHEIARVDYSMLPPSIITDIVKDEGRLQSLKKISNLNYGGGPLPQEVGDKICQHVSLGTSYGSTEMGVPPLLPKKPELWNWFRFDVEHAGIEFRPADEGTYELVFVRRPDLSPYQAIFATFPELTEYPTKDLFVPHPSEPGYWKYSGRRDDIIVLTNAEKFNPVSMEGLITSCPQVNGALVVGQKRFQSALVIEAKEPPGSEQELQGLIENIWPFVQRANQGCIAPGRISKELIMFTNPAKPFARAGKGTIQRAASVRLYESEIDSLYEAFESSQKSGISSLDLDKLHSAITSLQKWVSNALSLEQISIDADFFQLGMDSLQLNSLVRAVNASRNKDQYSIEPRQVYENSSCERLAQSLFSDPAPIREDDDDLDTWVQMQQIYKDITGALSRSLTTQKDREDPVYPRVPSEESQDRDSDCSGSTKIYSQHMDVYSASEDKEFLISMMPPDGGSIAWLQVLASFLINVNNWGLVNSFGAYQSFYETNFLSQKSAPDIAWIGTVQAGLLLIVGVFSGPLFDKGYFRVMLASAGITLVFALMMLSLSTQYYQIMLSQGILIGFCCGLLYIPSVALIPLYFKDRRGLALGLATSGASLGGIIYPIVFRRLLNTLGFGWATRIIGFIALGTLSLAFAISRPMDQLKKPARDFFELRALKELPFATFMIMAFVVFAAFLVPFFLTPEFASVKLGTDDNTSFYLLAVLNAAQLLGRIIPSAISDVIGGEILLISAQVVSGILGLSWIAVHNLGGFVVFLIFYGFVSGMGATLPAVVVPYLCPSLNFVGTRMGMIYSAAGVGALIGTPIATAAANDTGGFLGAQIWVGVCFLVGSVLFIPTAIAAFKQRRAVDLKRT